jgi:two-component system, LytTR family, sensor kinase
MFGVILRQLIKYYQFTHSAPIVFVPRLLAICLLLGGLAASVQLLLNFVFVYSMLNTVHVTQFQQYMFILGYLYRSFLLFSGSLFIWSLCYLVAITQRNRHISELRSLQIEKNMKEAQLNALSAKIDPHFIFNTLNNIRALINEDSKKARESILILSNILRGPLSQNPRDKITIAEELNFVKNYLHLSKLHLEERFRYQEEVAAQSLAALIPPMMLQILIENAIKHGINQLVNGGEILLQVNTTEDFLVCRITNSGQLDTNSAFKGFGIGISNIRERLYLLFGSNAQFNLFQTDDRVTACLKIPLEYNS